MLTCCPSVRGWYLVSGKRDDGDGIEQSLGCGDFAVPYSYPDDCLPLPEYRYLTVNCERGKGVKS